MRTYSYPRYANAFGGDGGWGGGFFNALGGLFTLGGSLAGGITGSRAAQAAAQAQQANAQAQLEAAQYGYQAALAQAETQQQGLLANRDMLKMTLIGAGVLTVLAFAGIIAYKLLVKKK